MSAGENKSFRRNILHYLQNNFLNSEAVTGLPLVSGTVNLNLAKHGGMNGKILTEVQPARENRSSRSHAFAAHYLAFMQGHIPELTLNANADYFVTAALTGCRLIIGNGGVMRHVDGGRYSDVEMDAMCANEADGVNFNTPRYVRNGAYFATVVVGERVAGNWIFYQQSYNYDSVLPHASRI